MQLLLALRPSHYLATLLIAVHATAIGSLIPLNLPFWAKLSLASLVLLSLIHHVRHAAWLITPSSAITIALSGNQATLTLRNGDKQEGCIMRDTLVTPWLAILNIQLPGRLARSLVIFPDSLDPELFRQLRVRLKWDMAA